MRNVPVLYKKKSECCGCTACYACCPRSAISMERDVLGFEYPIIDINRCVKCGRCVEVCPIRREIFRYADKA